VRGTLGAFATQGLDPQEAQLAAGALPGSPGFGAAPASQAGRLRLESSAQEEALSLHDGDHGLFYRGVAAAILHSAPPPVPLEDAVVQLEIIEAALRSSETGAPVHLDAA
jgi:predicted dehydrogenase